MDCVLFACLFYFPTSFVVDKRTHVMNSFGFQSIRNSDRDFAYIPRGCYLYGQRTIQILFRELTSSRGVILWHLSIFSKICQIWRVHWSSLLSIKMKETFGSCKLAWKFVFTNGVCMIPFFFSYCAVICSVFSFMKEKLQFSFQSHSLMLRPFTELFTSFCSGQRKIRTWNITVQSINITIQSTVTM